MLDLREQHEPAGRRHDGFLLERRLSRSRTRSPGSSPTRWENTTSSSGPGTRTSGSATRTTPTATAPTPSVTTCRSMPPTRERIRSGSASGCPAPLDYELTAHVWEIFLQDKWQMKSGLTLSLGIRYDLEVMPIDETGNAALLRSERVSGRQEQRGAAARASSGIRTARASRSCAAAMEFSTTGPCWGPSTTSSSTPSTPTRSLPSSRRTLPTRGPASGRFPTDPTLNIHDGQRAQSRRPRVHQFTVPAGSRAPEHRHGDLGRPRSRATLIHIRSAPATSARCGEESRWRRTTSG